MSLTEDEANIDVKDFTLYQENNDGEIDLPEEDELDDDLNLELLI